MASRLLTSVLRRTMQPPRLAPSVALLARAPLSTTMVHSGGPPGSGFTIITPDPTHTLPPRGLSSLRDPKPPASSYKTSAAGAATAAASGEAGTAKHSGGHPHHHAHHVDMGATEKWEDREEMRMEKEEQRHAKKTKGAGAGGKKAGATDAGQHGAGKDEDAGMNEHARDEAAKRTQDYSA